MGVVSRLKGLAVSVVLGGVLVVVLFAIVRKLPRTWWIWGAVVSMIFVTFTVMISPVYIFPIFNKYTRLDDPKITQPILSMARANGIPAQDVYEVDASKQTTRMSANVSGFGNTMRITLNDNLLRRGSPEEIEAVMGHEMGHYVLNHIAKDLMFMLIVAVCFFAISAVVAGLEPGALGDEVADSRHRRSGGTAAGGAAGLDLLLCPDADSEHPDSDDRSRS